MLYAVPRIIHVCRYLTEANIYLEVILGVLVEKEKLVEYKDICMLDRHSAASFDRNEFDGKLIIVLENTSTNTGNNVTHTKELLSEARLLSPASRMAVVDIPYLGRRALATLAWHLGESKFLIFQARIDHRRLSCCWFRAAHAPGFVELSQGFSNASRSGFSHTYGCRRASSISKVSLFSAYLLLDDGVPRYSLGGPQERFFDRPNDFPDLLYERVVEAEPLLNEMCRVLGEDIPL